VKASSLSNDIYTNKTKPQYFQIFTEISRRTIRFMGEASSLLAIHTETS